MEQPELAVPLALLYITLSEKHLSPKLNWVGQAALRQAGYVADQRSYKGQKIRCWVQPKHLQKTGCGFSLWTPNSGSCPTVRDAPDLSVVKQN
ncbi:hypothetical protein N8912_03750 [Rhodobacteraceae bacterium]|nr:hypothetical protein [Paracoccaceae bacterium]